MNRFIPLSSNIKLPGVRSWTPHTNRRQSRRSALLAPVALLLTVLLSLTASMAVNAELREAHLNNSLVAINAHKGKGGPVRGSGFVVQSDRYNGYVVTNARFLEGANTTTVRVPNSDAELVAQVLRVEYALDLALLKVNGLDVAPMKFGLQEPRIGDVVWSAVKWGNDNTTVGLSRGILGNAYDDVVSNVGMYSHSAVMGEGGIGSVMLNDCAHVIGYNMTTLSADASVKAISLSSLRGILASQNIKMTLAEGRCLSEIEVAQSKAELATVEAKRAQDEAVKAQALANSLEKKLQASNQRNESLLRQTREAREKADSALAAAESARINAEANKLEFQRTAASLEAESRAIKENFELSRIADEERFQDALARREEDAATRERTILGVAAFIVVIFAVAVFFLRGGVPGREDVVLPQMRPPKQNSVVPVINNGTVPQHSSSSEFVLDGKDEDGIRYLLRISGEQLSVGDGVVIGRNPKDSPYIINHADVSRKHARMKVMKDRVFIEDLGSTNGTSVNGLSIESKGPVSVDSGDQIIIGSVVMNLRVLSA